MLVLLLFVALLVPAMGSALLTVVSVVALL